MARLRYLLGNSSSSQGLLGSFSNCEVKGVSERFSAFIIIRKKKKIGQGNHLFLHRS